MTNLEKQLSDQDSADEKSDLEELNDRLRSIKCTAGTGTAHLGIAQDTTQPELMQVIYEKLKEYCEHSMLGDFQVLTPKFREIQIVGKSSSLSRRSTR